MVETEYKVLRAGTKILWDRKNLFEKLDYPVEVELTEDAYPGKVSMGIARVDDKTIVIFTTYRIAAECHEKWLNQFNSE